MKINIKQLCLYSLVGLGGAGMTSCNDFLDREPITSVTPNSYFTVADQIGAYVINYYNSSLVNSRGVPLYHQQAWNEGLGINDNNTDNFVQGAGSLSYFANTWQVPSNQNLKSTYSVIRTWNYLINTVEPKIAEGSIQGTTETINQYLGEAYFFRAMAYFNALATFGDLPIITEVLPDDDAVLQEQSIRSPRNEVARFILEDLDKAISLLQETGYANNQRINKQAAQLFKSRVALYEGTFEKYHQGTGRVPGDENWPGKNMSYNQGKTFDIHAEIDFFLGEAMSAASAVADKISLTDNNHVMNPEYGQIYGWNPYFEMFSQPSLANVPEVLLWKQYNKSLSITHDAPNRLQVGDDSGLMHSFITAFLCKDGLPIYASPLYKGDVSIDDEKTDRDERLRLFVWGESDVLKSDPAQAEVAQTGNVVLFGKPLVTNAEQQNRDITGYRQRKHYTYDYAQKSSDELLGTNACPIFRAAEAYLNYMEACYEKNRSLDNKAQGYWRALRTRAGVDADFNKTIHATDMSKEAALDDLGVWSGNNMVDATLYNIRRERRCEFLGEGMRWDDLIRWRSWDRVFTKPFVPKGINLWDGAYKNYTESGEEIVADGTITSNVSQKSQGKYLLPYAIYKTNNQLYDGYTWRKAFYLSPIGVEELQLASGLYQNPYWPTDGGLSLE